MLIGMKIVMIIADIFAFTVGDHIRNHFQNSVQIQRRRRVSETPNRITQAAGSSG